MNTTESLAHFIVNCSYEQIPDDVKLKGMHSLIDTLACILVGSTEAESENIAGFIKRAGGNPESRVLGAGSYQTSAAQAALVNGTMAHVLDYDDTYSTISYKAINQNKDDLKNKPVGMTIGHMGACLLPAALAIGESVDASGQELLAAYVAGFETACRIGHVLGLKHYATGYHSTSTIGCMAATAAAARLLKLDQTQVCMALGIAAAHASGLRGNFGSMTKPLQAGNAARIGVFAAQLAENGFTAGADILGTELGYIDVLSMGGNKPLDAIHDQPEGGYYLLKGNSIKFLPCGNALQSSLETMLDLVEEYQITADQVSGVEEKILVPRYIVCTNDGVNYRAPTKGIEGKFILPYGLAAALLDRQITLATYTDGRVQQDDIQSLFAKIKLTLVTEQSDEELIVRLHNGEEISKPIGKSKGHWSVPFPERRLDDKFIDCANQALDKHTARRALECVRDIASLGNISALTELVSS